MSIVLIITGLVAGYFFLRYFNRIDAALFGNGDEDYAPFGLITVGICCFAGAFGAGGTFIEGIIDAGWNTKIIQEAVVVLVTFAVAFSIYEAIVRLQSVGAVFGKIVFMLVACAIATAIGAIGAVVVLVVLTVVALLYIISAMLTGSAGRIGGGGGSNDSNEEYTTVDENGFERKLTDMGCGNYKDDKGERWKESGYGRVERDD